MYPRTYFAMMRPAPTPATAFIAMPFAKSFVPVYSAIKKALNEESVAYTRVDELLGGQSIMEDVLNGLSKSDLVIADVTGRNPNVFYELGIAHMCKPAEKVLLLSQEVDSIPFDLRPYRHIIYSSSKTGLGKLTGDLRKAVRAVAQPVHRVVVDPSGRGRIEEKLMAPDHCLYDFEILESIGGHGSAKLRLRVTRHVMAKRPTQNVVYDNGLGLMEGHQRPIRGTPWSIMLESISRGGRASFIIQNAISIERP